MEAGKASRSAMGSALLRAAHVREDRPPWVFEDTLAGRLLDAAEVAELEASMAAWPPVVRRAFRVSHAVRARLAEDVATTGLAAGRRDYVLLGAGRDTFAWRHPRAGDFVVWEIDHPDTQACKRAALRRAGLAEIRLAYDGFTLPAGSTCPGGPFRTQVSVGFSGPAAPRRCSRWRSLRSA
jgi:methyltransferase (TIGR00027 family)